METSKTRKMSLLSAAAAIIISASWLFPPVDKIIAENEFLNRLRSRLKVYAEHLPEDRVYLHLDRPFYTPGDDIWFSAYVRDGATLLPSQQSEIVHAELIDPRGSVIRKLSLICEEGKSSGDFSLEGDSPGGLYKIRAYTNWMKNSGEDNYFEKEVQVQKVILPTLKMKLDYVRKAYGPGDEVQATLYLTTNENRALSSYQLRYVAKVADKKITEASVVTDPEGYATIRFTLPGDLQTNDGLLNVLIPYQGSTESVSRSIPIVLNKISFEMFPEGGDLVEGFESKVAFRARNEFGKAADVEGEVRDREGRLITTFKSQHQGMGYFFLAPSAGEKYYATLSLAGSQQRFELPQAQSKGYVLLVQEAVNDQLHLHIQSPVISKVNLVAQLRGEIYHAAEIKVIPGINKAVVPLNVFPAGVAQITLFDAGGIERAERLVFVNRHKKLNVTIRTDKEKYLPREKVKMTVEVKDEQGFPVPARLSLAVVNDQLLSFADNRDGNLISQFLLEQDLKEKVEEPAYYFDEKEPNSGKALDLLMLTSGWRRFTWEKVLQNDLPDISFHAEKRIIAGTIVDGYTGEPVKFAEIRIKNSRIYRSDSSGNFVIRNCDLRDDVSLTVRSALHREQSFVVNQYRQDMVLHLNPLHSYWRGQVSTRKNAGGALPPMAQAREVEAVAFQDLSADAEQGVNKFQEEAAENGPGEIRTGSADTTGMVMDLRFSAAKRSKKVIAGSQRYHRARIFAAPVYNTGEITTRSDFRATLIWIPDLKLSSRGRAQVEFFTADEISSFRATAEGFSVNGLAGSSSALFFTQMPFSMRVKMPEQLVAGDRITLPVTLLNNTDRPLGGVFRVRTEGGLQIMNAVPQAQSIMPHSVKVLNLEVAAVGASSLSVIQYSFDACAMSDAFQSTVAIAPRGFPVKYSFSGDDASKEFTFSTSSVVKGSLRAVFNAYPDVTSELLSGIEGILQEPYGCFEQTSCTAYPNAMVLDYFKKSGRDNGRIVARATELMDRGYRRLVSFETSTRGYEWFGAAPAHEGLTAYGIMEFSDMQKAGQKIDGQMMQRTVQWLLSRRDGRGGFAREQRALHDFGRISNEVMNTYIVYALAESGITDIADEFNHAVRTAVKSGDPYLLALSAIAAADLGHKNICGDLLSDLFSHQEKNGRLMGKSHSITYSEGTSLAIETTALSALALMKAERPDEGRLQKCIGFLISSRSGSGVFGSTQGTILALKALTAYAQFSRRIAEDGLVEIYIDGKKVADKKFESGQQTAVIIGGLEKFISEKNDHRIKVVFQGKKSLPYSVSVQYNTTLPLADKSCEVELATQLASEKVEVGSTIRLTATISNRGGREIPSAIAVVGLPAGCIAQPWQLKELQEKALFDHYEIIGNNIAFYYRGMEKSAIRVINLDLKAEVPGEFSSPASSAYLYYKNEFRSWAAPLKLKISS